MELLLESAHAVAARLSRDARAAACAGIIPRVSGAPGARSYEAATDQDMRDRPKRDARLRRGTTNACFGKLSHEQFLSTIVPFLGKRLVANNTQIK
jgi:hypothetical protein